MTDKLIEQTYPARLGMPIMHINQIKNIILEDIKRSIENNLLEDKQCFHIVGPAGVGKTAITKQIADELCTYFNKTFHYKKITAPVLFRDDFIMPYPNNENDFHMRFSDYIPKPNEEFGLFVIDENSRGDEQLQQMMWQIQNETQLHTYKFPKGWFVISVDNPDDDNYQMNYLEDAAGLRRCLHLYVKVSSNIFIQHALKNNFHKFVIQYIKKFPDKVYDFTSQQQGRIYANPASWEKVSNHLYKYEKDLNDNFTLFESICGGLLNIFEAHNFCDFVKNINEFSIKSFDIFMNYDKVRKYVKTYVNKKENNKIHNLLTDLFKFLCNEQIEPDNNNIKNLTNFLTDIPIDIAASFVTKLNELTIGSDEHLYIMSILIKMKQTNENFGKEFFDKLVSLAA